MIQIKLIKSVDGKRDLVETSTTLPESKKLLQIETNLIYYDKAVDVIVGYKEDGTPIPKYTYREVDKTQEEIEEDKKVKSLLGGNN